MLEFYAVRNCGKLADLSAGIIISFVVKALSIGYRFLNVKLVVKYEKNNKLFKL